MTLNILCIGDIHIQSSNTLDIKINEVFNIDKFENCYCMNTDVIMEERHHLETYIKADNYIHGKHHEAHAAGCFYQSPYQEALAFSFDGGGNDGFFNISHCLRGESPKLLETRDGYTMSVNILDIVPGTVDAQQKLKYSRKDLTEYWNIMFSRNYSEYWAVKMCICSCPGNISLYNKIKIGLQWPFRNYYTNKLVLKLQTLEKYEW